MEHFSEFLHGEINRTLKRGSFYAAILAFLSTGIIFALEFSGLVHDFSIPGTWAFVCDLYSLFAFWSAGRGLVKGWMQYAVVLPFTSLPSVLFLMSHHFLPSGTATYIAGPASYLYFFVIIMTGFLFNRTLSTLAGLFVGIQYFSAYLLGREHLQHISAGDPLMLQDLTSMPIYFFKSLMMVFAGIVVGVFSSNRKRLIGEILREEREKHAAERKRDEIKEIFGKYVTAEIRDEVLAGRIPLDGERKDVTVLFSDLRGFTPMTESNDPKLVIKIMNSYFKEMAGAIRDQGGLVLQFIGDEI